MLVIFKETIESAFAPSCLVKNESRDLDRLLKLDSSTVVCVSR
jgi:hypothetical protein